MVATAQQINGPTAVQPVINPLEIAPKDVLTGTIEDQDIEPLRFTVHPRVRQGSDAGRAPQDLVISRMRLVLRRSPEQQAALRSLAAAQLDSQSPEHHRWLTPEEFGGHFGLSQNDLNKLTAWLKQGGFVVNEVPKGRWTIVFSGTVGGVESAFHTEIHYYNINGTRHRANSTPLQIPKALAPVVVGILGIHDFRPVPVARRGGRPNFESGGSYYLLPSDYATIYDINPLYSNGIDGSGQTIAIVGVCEIDTSIVQTFRALTGLPPNNTSMIVLGEAPAQCAGNELTEPYLDVEWSGAVATGAQIVLVVGSGTDPVEDSAGYIVDSDLAPVMSTSFASCEADLQEAGNEFWSDLWAQASLQGITSLVSAGDSGAAGCDAETEGAAMDGLGVNGLCSTPYDICVGGTEFNDFSDPSLYWSQTGNALGYIPEEAWNESGLNGGSGLWATGGGYSVEYPITETPWQTGNSSSWRGVPDVSLTAARHDGYFICEDTGCNLSIFNYAYGTSAAAPSFAGLMALVVQSTNTWQGLASPLLYALASGTSPFHDITAGNNDIPCVADTPDCGPSGYFGYSAGPGWDPVTGLGSVDANLMVTYWGSPTVTTGAATSLTSSNATLNGTVNPNGSYTNYWYLYGTSSSLAGASQTDIYGIGNGTTATSAQANISGLAAGTTYYYQIQASSSPAISTGNILSFVTQVELPTATTGAATLVTSSSAGLNGTVNPNGAYTSYWFIYGTNSSLLGASQTVGAGIGSGTTIVSVEDSIPGLAAGTTYYYQIQASNSAGIVSGGIASFTTAALASCTYSLSASSASLGANALNGDVGVTAPSGCSWTAWSNAAWLTITSGNSGNGNGTVSYSVAANAGTTQLSGTLTIAGQTFTITQAAIPVPLGFFTLTPCRVADTRVGFGFSGAFGPPSLMGDATRSFPIPQSACSVPATAQAYSLNVTVVPPGPVDYLTVWPTGSATPLVATLNSLEGATVGNAAIVSAGTDGAISLFASNHTDVVIDINGYFAPPSAPQSLAFYPVTPCRVADTRAGFGFSGLFGPPSLVAGATRNFPVQQSSCGIPSSAQAYSVRMTVVAPGPLNYLTTWSEGQPLPTVATLNAPNGGVMGNEAIVPAGTVAGEPISVYVSDNTDLVIDVNGYFAPPGPGGLNFYAVAPCRVADTRAGFGFGGAFGPPSLVGGASRYFPMPSSTCGIPDSAQAYSLNMTAVPTNSEGFLTAYPFGSTLPNAATVNFENGRVVGSAAIVPAGAGGAINVFASSPTDLVIDISGYFAP
jgi:pseudomonalisin